MITRSVRRQRRMCMMGYERFTSLSIKKCASKRRTETLRLSDRPSNTLHSLHTQIAWCSWWFVWRDEDDDDNVMMKLNVRVVQESSGCTGETSVCGKNQRIHGSTLLLTQAIIRLPAHTHTHTRHTRNSGDAQLHMHTRGSHTLSSLPSMNTHPNELAQHVINERHVRMKRTLTV